MTRSTEKPKRTKTAGARHLMLQASILFAPFVLLAFLVVAVDPFNYFAISDIVADDVKELRLGRLPLWKIHEFKRSPTRNILIGDSHMQSFSPSAIEALTGHDYSNLSYDSGTLVEAIETYWLASSITHLDAVYLGLGVAGLNAYHNSNRIADVEAMEENPLLYVSSRLVIRATFGAAFHAWAGRPFRSAPAPIAPDIVWRRGLDQVLPRFALPYEYPTKALARLKEVAEDCRRRGTRLVIVIPPTHVDLQAAVSALGRDGDIARFRRFVATLAPVYDFDYANELTANRAGFLDPFHFGNNDALIREIWGGERRYARYSEPGDANMRGVSLRDSPVMPK